MTRAFALVTSIVVFASSMAGCATTSPDGKLCTPDDLECRKMKEAAKEALLEQEEAKLIAMVVVLGVFASVDALSGPRH